MVVACLIASAPVFAQTAAKPLKFEVVSIKRNKSLAPARIMIGAQPGVTTTANEFRCTNGPLRFLLMAAYTTGHGMEGLPEWAGNPNKRYDVVAKVADEDLPQWQDATKRPAMMREMLRGMLADRMKLAAHIESHEMPVYELTVTKGGPKFKTAETVDGGELKQRHAAGFEAQGGGVVALNEAAGELRLYAVSMPVFAQGTLSAFAGRPVVDKTGLNGRYDVQLPLPSAPGAENADRGSIFTILQEQLGLKLVPAKGPVGTLVIDHIERPTEN